MAKNFTVTFRDVGNKKAEVLEDDIMNILEKRKIKSAGIELGMHDVNDLKTHIQKQDEPNYILQYKDDSCWLITLLNAYIHKTGSSPIEYKSDEFRDLVYKCGGKHGAIININPALKRLNLKLIENKHKTLDGLKKWMIWHLKRGNMIDFAMWHPRWNAHSVLLTEHNTFFNVGKSQKYEVFRAINGQVLTENSTTEFLTWDILIREVKERFKGKKWYNSTQKVNGLVNTTLNQTSAIIFAGEEKIKEKNV